MKFNYKSFGKNRDGEQVIRPIIPIKLKGGDKEFQYDVLVDSGADVCIFDSEIAELIGINVTSGRVDTFGGVTGVSKASYIHEVEMEVGGWPYKAEVSFAPGISRFGHGIVGQKGFFEFFKVGFDYTASEIEVKPKK
jgi:hypothetical protein